MKNAMEEEDIAVKSQGKKRCLSESDAETFKGTPKIADALAGCSKYLPGDRKQVFFSPNLLCLLL